jgi:hypothetical protein
VNETARPARQLHDALAVVFKERNLLDHTRDQQEALMPRPEHWTDDAKAAWLKARERPEQADRFVFAEHPGPATHTFTYRPEVRIGVVLPPWIDVDDWRREASNDWDGWLEDGVGLTVLDRPGHALVTSEVTSGVATVEPVPLDPEALDGPTIPPPDAPRLDLDISGDSGW